MYIVQAGVQVSDAELPSWNITDLPLQLGDWKGKNTELDERLFRATGAHAVVNRLYTNDSGMVVSLHLAIFTDPNEGIWHSPVNCYLSSGWIRLEDEKLALPGTSDENAIVSLSMWKKSSEKACITYWFQLGEHRLYSRYDLGTVRWKMRGLKWPALIKVLIHTSANSKTEETKDQMLAFADQVYQWINQPQHLTPKESTHAEHAAAE